MNHKAQLKQAIEKDDAQSALAILNQESLLNQYCLDRRYTPVGFAAEYNKLSCLDTISSIPGVDLSLGVDRDVYIDVRYRSAMWLALQKGHVEAAKILAGKGAACTEEEIANLGEKYTNFQQIIGKEQLQVKPENPAPTLREEPVSKRERGLIRHWMDSFEFEKLKQWLGECKNQLEGPCKAGEVPVVGWLQLAASLKSKEASKINVEAELDQIAREQEQLTEQMRNLQQKQQTLENRKQQLQEQMKELHKIAALQAENQESIAFLTQKEKESLANLSKKMENPYFMGDLDADDVSTVFSLFNMDSLFPRYKEHDQYKNLEVTANAEVGDLRKELKLDFAEAVELLWKLKLLEHGETGAARHLAKCSICSSTKPGVLLQEYGMKQEERKQIEAKMEGWKGFYFAAATAASATLELNIPAGLAPKLATCWVRIQKAHKWEHPDD